MAVIAGQAAEILHHMDREFGGPGRSVDFFEGLFHRIGQARTYGELAVEVDTFATIVWDCRRRVLKQSGRIQNKAFELFTKGKAALPKGPRAVAGLAMDFAADSVFANDCCLFLAVAFQLAAIARAEAGEMRINNGDLEKLAGLVAPLTRKPGGKPGRPFKVKDPEKMGKYCAWIWRYIVHNGMGQGEAADEVIGRFQVRLSRGRLLEHYRDLWGPLPPKEREARWKQISGEGG